MKRIRSVCLIALVAFGVPVGAVLAQNGSANSPSGKSPYGVITVPIEKVYSHSKGYVIEYRKNGMGTERLYLPLEWFTLRVNMENPRKGELYKIRNGNVLPYLAVYYKDGKTDHVRLYVRDNSHPTWGTILNGVDLDDQFDGVEEITISR
ncbi:MAG: hypothetical protein LBD44_03685 [Spirochaetaceae bacterium]|jgi:hypothetical protein|nr:hypothetical protein [Spirochaetaceae bacterium]